MNGGGSGGDSSSSALSQWTYAASRRYQHLLDKWTPHVVSRWVAFSIVLTVYALRVYFVQGFYIITYALGIYILQLFLLFLSPQVDPEIQEYVEGPTLPTRGSDEFRPFVRRLPEFKFWITGSSGISSCNSFLIVPIHHPLRRKKLPFSSRCSITKAFCFAFVLTFFRVFDVPVFWPILLFYWLVLFVSTMKRQIMHMVKYKYVPFSFGKQRYSGKKVASTDDKDGAKV